MNGARVLPLALVVLLATFPRPATAERLDGSVSDMTTITHPTTGIGRVVFHADLSVAEEHVAVRRAFIRVPRTSLTVSEDMTLRIFPVTTAWSRGSVGWASGWSQEGGDFDPDLHARAEVPATGSDEIVFDITMLAKEILEHGADNLGFLVSMDPKRGEGLPAEDIEGWDELSGVEVEVQYRRVPRASARS